MMLKASEFNRLKSLQRAGVSARAAAREVGCSERTARKYFKQERFQACSRPVRSSILDPYKDEIRMWLHEYDQYTAQQLFQKIAAKGYPGGYTIVKDYVRKIRPPSRGEAHGEYDPRPGESAQVDFGECGMIRAGESLHKVWVFSMVLSWSRMMYLEFVFGQSMEYFLTGHRHAFEFFRAVPQATRPDRCKTAVIGQNAEGKVVYNSRYEEFLAHYGVVPNACDPYSGFQKPSVERGIGYIKDNFLNGKDLSCYTLERLNREGRDWLDRIANVRKHATTKERPVDRFTEERQVMKKLPPHPYDCSTIRHPAVDKQARFQFDGNRYSVPPLYHNVRINLHVLPDRLLAYYNGKLLASHQRVYGACSRPIVLPEHQRSLKRCEARERSRRQIMQLLELGPIAEPYYHKLCERRLNPQHHVRKILALAQLHGAENTVRALEDSHACGAYSSDYIHNLLSARGKLQDLASPLQLKRNQDLLDIELDPPDPSQYDRYLKGEN